MMPTFRQLKAAGLILSVCLGVAASAQAITLDEQKQYDKWVAYYTTAESQTNYVQKQCGISVPVKLDTALTTPFMAANRNAASYCDEALKAIGMTCSDAAGKAAVTAKIKSLTCNYSRAQDNLALALNNGDLQFSFGVGSKNLADQVKKFLGGNL